MTKLNSMLKRYSIIFSLFALLAAACTNEDILNSQIDQDANLLELAGIHVSIDNGSGATRASVPTGKDPAPLTDSIGRTSFGTYDQLVFTNICRTKFPLPQYSYNEIVFNHDNGSWANSGSTKIYWSDGASGHTFIGYCLPHKTDVPAVTEDNPETTDVNEMNFDWEKKNVAGSDIYFGSIGDPTKPSELIDYSQTETIEGVAIPQNLRKEDLLLTYDTDIKNENGEPVADIVCHHALASVRVTVSITGFSTSDSDHDASSMVYDLEINDQPVMYKWTQRGFGVEPLTESDATNISLGAWNQNKKMKLWQPHPDGVGTGSSKTFTFYGINVPGTYDVPISFKVKYPDPLNPESQEHLLEKKYSATLTEAIFRAGYCTSITIALNHKNEKITVGAEYMTWEYLDSPDEGNLSKKSTFLTTNSRDSITIMGDAKATIDDATWLYVEDDGTIRDVYGHTGSESDPFQISTAKQLLSFAYEVKGNMSRGSTIGVKSSPAGSDKTTLNISSGFSFENYYIKLDAGLTLQKTSDKTKKELTVEGASQSEINNGAVEVEWPGIGDENNPFNGTFLAGDRYISRLYGKSFFINIGPKASVCQLILNKIIEVDDKGGLAEKNSGVVSACKVDGNVISISTDPVGSLVGTNNGLLFACYHIGDVKGAGNVGGLVGSNTGDNAAIVACYNIGKITKGGSGTAYGVAAAANPGSIYGCFFDKSKAGELSISSADGQATGYPSSGKTYSEIIKSEFVGTRNTADANETSPSLNGIIYKWTNALTDGSVYFTMKSHLSGHYYESQPASSPSVY